MQQVDRIIIARHGKDVSTPELGSERADLAALVSPSSSLSPVHTSGTGDSAHPGSLIPPTSYQMNLATLASPSSSLSHAHTSPPVDLAHPGVLTPPTGDQVDSAALAGHSSNPSLVITDSQITRMMIDLYNSPAHASVGDSDSKAMDTLPASNGDREVLPEVTRRGSSATDLSVAQNPNQSWLINDAQLNSTLACEAARRYLKLLTL